MIFSSSPSLFISFSFSYTAVYNNISATVTPSFSVRLSRYRTAGPWAGIAACIIASALHLLLVVIEFIWPAYQIEKCRDFPWIWKGIKIHK